MVLGVRGGASEPRDDRRLLVLRKLGRPDLFRQRDEVGDGDLGSRRKLFRQRRRGRQPFEGGGEAEGAPLGCIPAVVDELERGEIARKDRGRQRFEGHRQDRLAERRCVLALARARLGLEGRGRDRLDENVALANACEDRVPPCLAADE